VTFILLLVYLDVHNPRTRTVDGLKAIDWIGSVTMLAVTLMVLIGLNFGGTTFPWNSPKVIVLIVVGSLLSIVFVLVEKRLAKYPLMPMSIFSDRSNVATLAVTFFHGVVFLGSEYYLPIYFQSARLASPLRSGALIIPFTATEALSGVVAGVIVHQTGRYVELINAGMLLTTLGVGLFILFSASTNLGQVLGITVVAGIGSGFIFSPPIVAIQARVAQHNVASATATLGFIRNIAAAISAVVGGVVFTNGMSSQKQALQAAGLNSTTIIAFSGRDTEANVPRISSIVDLHQRFAVQSAYARSMRNCWILYTCFAGLGVIAAVFIKKGVLSSEHVETKTGLREKDAVKDSPATTI